MIDDTTNPQIEREDNELPLAGMLVIDFSQFLSGPVAAVRLADLGARVVKVERPSGGDSGRQLAFAGLMLDGDPVSFHAMNRGKESLTADLKDDDDLALVRRLVDAADVVIQNFRPGVMARLGLDYDRVRVSNPGLVYATVSGYGEDGPWVNRPGQDLLAQAVTAVPYLNGSADAPPTAVGVSIADTLASGAPGLRCAGVVAAPGADWARWPRGHKLVGMHVGPAVRALVGPASRAGAAYTARWKVHRAPVRGRSIRDLPHD